ncbi:MAG: YbdD/YjiX family protein [Chitinophagaceae bacterium]|nr:YbdD/YjiX family protein [Oligoflexus sp.]
MQYRLKARFKRLFDILSEVFRSMVGVPNYETYRIHHVTHHPDQPLMNYTEFFRNSQARRHEGSKGGRCF